MRAYLKTIYQYFIKPILLILLGIVTVGGCFFLLYLLLKYLSKVKGLGWVQIISFGVMMVLLIVALADAYLLLKPRGSFKHLLAENKKEKHND